ncbi:MAG: T9SS type A sorting domain-containing protein, partial [Bacteroidales bacterium]|nr:T9SS type A sorting domain-containing protein [Bacteroidales bacterium]
PNPARGSFFVEHSATAPVQMEVCSVSGQLLESRTLTAERTECRLPAPGAYWVRFTSSLGTQVRKVVRLP